MRQVAVLGESRRAAWFALAGATVLEAEDPEAARRAWKAIGDETAVVVLTPMAAAAISNLPAPRVDLLTVVMPTPPSNGASNRSGQVR
ncbi:MAG: V-type ATP synthase subunit F [Acidimicrobiales bacterium]